MKLRHLVPFGLMESKKPRHFREIAKVVWENRHALGYAWRILRHGVCDGCSLGPYGLRDNVMEGTHLCLTRLKLLKLNTMRALDLKRLPDLATLRGMSNEELHGLGRIPCPLRFRRGETQLSRISWEEALDRIAAHFREKRAKGGADEIGFFVTSRGLTNETYYLSRKLASLIGSNNIDLCARLCHAASVDGLKDTLGIGAPTCSLSDIIGSDLVVIFGSNLANNQPVTMKYLHYAKQKGTKVVVVNPYREPGLERYWIPSIPSSALFGSKLMDHFYQVRVGGDMAFMFGTLKALIAIEGIDFDFIARATTGFDELREKVERNSWSTLEEQSGLPRGEMEEFARIYARARTAVFIYSMGLTQHRFGVQNVYTLVNLALARGMVGREKCGIIPIRGHSGMQGGGECGVDPDKLPGGFPLTPENVRCFEAAWGAPVATHKGLRTGQMIEAAHAGRITTLYNVGGNLLETLPDRRFVEEALEGLELRVHQDIVFNSSTVLNGEEVILLPGQTRYEQRGGGSATSTERRIRFAPEIPGPRVAESRAEWEILQDIGRRFFPQADGPFSLSSSAAVREEMSRVMPLYKGIETLVREGDHIQWGGPRLFSDRKFEKMPNGKATFIPLDLPAIDIPEGYVYVTTRRGKQFNSITYGSFDPLTNRRREDIFVSEIDADRYGLREGDRVVLASDVGRMEGICRIAPIRAKNVQVHWPEANVLIPRRYDPISGEPDYNALARIKPL